MIVTKITTENNTDVCIRYDWYHKQI